MSTVNQNPKKKQYQQCQSNHIKSMKNPRIWQMQVELQPLWCLSTSQDTGVQRRAQGLDLCVAFAGVAQAADVEPMTGRGAANGLATWLLRIPDTPGAALVAMLMARVQPRTWRFSISIFVYQRVNILYVNFMYCYIIYFIFWLLPTLSLSGMHWWIWA